VLLALLAALMFAPKVQQSRDTGISLANPLTGANDAMVLVKSDRLDTPKLSPKTFSGKKWQFDWVTSGFGKDPATGQLSLRFRVFSEERKPQNDPAVNAAIMDLRMWQLLNHKLKIDHADMSQGLKLVDEYLCWGGTAGGEQTLGEDIEGGHARRVNTIYIYDIASFKDPMEMAREVAHEYGHAVLPPVGGFQTPEDWANGYLGERLFLRWLRDEYEAGRIDSAATMGIPFQSLDAWVKKNVDPLVLDASSHAPNRALLGSKGQKAMNAYMGLVLYADSVLPNQVVARSFKLTGSMSAKDYPQALVDACDGASYTVNVPPNLYAKKLWLPLGKSKVQGGKITARSGPWAQIQPGVGSLIILAPAQ
jgi:hypothetical protein